MNRPTPWWVRAYRVLFASLALLAIAVQARYSLFVLNFPPSNFFSFFTIQGNLIAAAVTLWSASSTTHLPVRPIRDWLRGAVVLYMSIIFVVYGLLLSGYQQALQTQIAWVDTVLHRVFPLVIMIDWLIAPPRTLLAVRRGLLWVIYPLLYAVYSLIRGPIVGWYPYPFLNPALNGGYGGVAIYFVAILLGALVFAWLVVKIGNRVRIVTTGVPRQQAALGTEQPALVPNQVNTSRN